MNDCIKLRTNLIEFSAFVKCLKNYNIKVTDIEDLQIKVKKKISDLMHMNQETGEIWQINYCGTNELFTEVKLILYIGILQSLSFVSCVAPCIPSLQGFSLS